MQTGHPLDRTEKVMTKCRRMGGTYDRQEKESPLHKRTDPGFLCTSPISKEEVCKAETKGLIDRLFGGSRKALFSSLLEDESLTAEEIDALRKLIDGR